MNPRISVALVLPWFFCGAILATQKAFGEESEAPQKDTPRPEDSLRRGDYEEAVEGFKKVLEAEAEVERIETLFASPDFHVRHGHETSELTAALDMARERASALYERWAELEEIG